MFGAWLCGAVVSVGDPALAVGLLAEQQRETGAAVVVTTRRHAAAFLATNLLVEEGRRARHILVLDAEPGATLPAGAQAFAPLLAAAAAGCPPVAALGAWRADLPAVIHWSSGTTGRPKGILHGQAYLHAMLRPSKLPRATIAFSSNIFFHGGAFLLPLDGGIFNGFTCCFIREEDFCPLLVLDKMAEHRAQFYMCGPNHITALVSQPGGARDLASMLCVMPSGGGVSSATVAGLRRLFPKLMFVFVFYGSSEVPQATPPSPRWAG